MKRFLDYIDRLEGHDIALAFILGTLLASCIISWYLLLS